MNTALIFAGGVGTRMNSRSKPKQFLELHGKPIIIHTLEEFEYHPSIDNVIIVSLESKINELKKFIRRFELTKISTIVPGGSTGFESIYNGLMALENKCNDKDLVLIHDGVRPLVDEQLISSCILCAEKHGNAVSAVPVSEGIVSSEDGKIINEFTDRKKMYATKAPQVFEYKFILDLYKRAKDEGFTPVESAHLCYSYGAKLHLVMSAQSNIKITTSTDYYIFRAIQEAIENNQIMGY